MRPGDIVFKPDPIFGKHRFWQIEGVFLGGEGQESLVQLRSLSYSPGSWGEAQPEVKKTLVPEFLIREFVYAHAPTGKDAT